MATHKYNERTFDDQLSEINGNPILPAYNK